jgi:hypothetical protein
MRLFLSAAAAVALITGAPAQVILAEIMADNASGREDDFGLKEDWIELYNSGSTAVSLDGWWLSDDAGDDKKWRFPAVAIPPQGTLLVWASGRNRIDPGSPLHTNFSLSRNGEFLGLYRPDDLTGLPVLESSFGAGYPPQAPDISYGISFSRPVSQYVLTGQIGRYRVLPNNGSGQANYSGSAYASGDIGTGQPGGWNVSPSFSDSSWTLATTGLGYDTGGGLNAWISTNCQTAMRNVNPSICFRRTFTVADPSTFTTCTFRMRYEDGFVAWLNGVEIARANFNGTPAHNSVATAALEETIPNAWTEYSVPVSLLVPGANVLAIQGLNSSSGSSDFLLLPELEAAGSATLGGEVYFPTPTPAAPNNAGTAGAVLLDATPVDPFVPRPLGNSSSPPLKTTVRVIQTLNPLTYVRSYYRTMWGGELAVTMNDAGNPPDDVPGDGIFSGNVPTTAPAAGQMFRWRIEARDTAGNLTRLPAHADPLDSPQYFGTVAQDPATSTSQLPVLEWFVENSPANGPTAASFRGSCYYLGRFYDNVGHLIHGQTTAGFAKKSYDFDSNRDHRFVWKEGERPVKDLNLLTNYADKTKARNTLSHEIGALAGTPYHFAFPVRVQLNGAFHGVMDLVEDGDDRMLERNGLDPEGAFYKIYAENLTSAAEKKTRRDENHADLQAMAAGLDPGTRTLDARRSFAYDEVNLPATVNYLVTRQFNSDSDHGHKNFYLFRDTNGTREWQPVIWDVDLSQGHNWNGDNGTGGYFNDTLSYQNPLNAHTTNNRLYNIVLESAEMRQMWTRRMRTLMDRHLQPPGTVDGFLETRLRAIAASIDPDPAVSAWTDGDLDFSRWGIHSNFIANRPREEVERVVAGYIGPRRGFLFNTAANRPLLYAPGFTASTPIPNSPQTNAPGMVVIDAADYLPASGNQAEEYLLLRNPGAEAVDISGWTLEGGISHVFEGGTVIPPGDGSPAAEYRGLLHVAKDAAAFRDRGSGPTGGQKRLVQGNYSGQLSARGETVTLRDDSGQWIAAFSYPGAPSALQQHLRIAEIHYHPVPPSPAEEVLMPAVIEDDFEFIELVNIGPDPLDLTGARFSEGIAFTFPATLLGPGQRLVVAKNPAALALRHPSIGTPVLGPYADSLANAGEVLKLEDAVGENILEFEFKDGWYPVTDGDGHALVLRDPAGTAYDAYDDPRSWAIGIGDGGSPGLDDGTFAQAYYGWDNFHFTALERDDPLVAGPDADPDGDGRPNADEYALGTDPRVADLPQVAFTWWADDPVRHPALSFRRPAGALDVFYELLAAPDLDQWEPVESIPAATTALGGGLEEAVLRHPDDDSAGVGFLRLGYTVEPR